MEESILSSLVAIVVAAGKIQAITSEILILCLHWQSRNSTVQYGTVQYGTARYAFTFQKHAQFARLRGLAARTNHVRFNVAMPIDACSSTEYRCSVHVRCHAYFMLCGPDMELERSALVLSLFARSSRRRTCLSAPSYSSIILHKQRKLCEMRRRWFVMYCRRRSRTIFLITNAITLLFAQCYIPSPRVRALWMETR